MLDEMNDSNFIFNVFLLWWIIALLFVLLFLLETMDMLWKKEFWLLSVTMSFNFSDVKKLASKLKESVSSNVTSLLQNSNSGNNVSSSIKNGINGVIQSVKTGSMAVGAKIVQTKDSLLTKTNEVIDVVIAPCQIKYIVDNLGIRSF